MLFIQNEFETLTHLYIKTERMGHPILMPGCYFYREYYIIHGKCNLRSVRVKVSQRIGVFRRKADYKNERRI